MLCPCCKQEMPGTRLTISLDTNVVSSPQGTAKLRPRTAEFVSILQKAGPRGIEYERIATLMWGAQAHEIDNDNNLKTHACQARRALKPLGYTVAVQRSFG